MRISTYLGFAAGLAAGACLVSFNPKARQAVTEVKEMAMTKMEEAMTEGASQPQSDSAM